MWRPAKLAFGMGLLAALLAVLAPAVAAAPRDDTAASREPEAADVIPTRSVLQIMRDGGLLMYPIALCSIIVLAIALERTMSLRTGHIIPAPFVTRFLQQLKDGSLDREQAIALCEENGSPAAQVLCGAVRKWGRPGVEIEQAIIDAGERATNGLRKYLRVLNCVTNLGPLLGLLGTVTGMIKTFNAVAHGGMGRAERLAGGIGEAMLTTAFGLFVAIPSMVLYMYFVSKVERLVAQLDRYGQEVVNLISAEELADRKAGKARRVVRKEAA